MTFVLLFIGFAILLFSADWLVDGASALARKLNIPNIIVGLTVVAFGTSAPELVVSLMSALNGESALSLTNVLGSNIINTYVILGVSAIIYPLACGHNTFRFEIPLSLCAALLVLILGTECFAYITPLTGFTGLSRFDGITLLIIFCGFIIYTIYQALNNKEQQSDDDSPLMPLWKAGILIVVGLAGLVGGGKLIVDNAIEIAIGFNVPTEIIGVTIVALGTSLPELATSTVAAFKKNTDLAIGNVIGSNIFNIFAVLGISATISPLTQYNNLVVDAATAATASGILLLFVTMKNNRREITRWEGVILLLIYAAYLSWTIYNI